jgi:membrane-bound lytic murein transglycosylase A
VTEEALEPEDIDTANTHRTRGLVRPPHQQSSSAELDRVIESLLPPSRRATAGPPNTASAARLKLENEGKTPAAAPQAQRARISEESATELLAPGSVANAIPNSDPSYVFFRPIPESNDGPIGALGVPLTAGRSVAVDPRTTPLGFPVFISTRQPGRTEALNRLMLAQDTGGAISGAVRADYFWGHGVKAFTQASQMKEGGRMWLLLPKNQKISPKISGTLLRGVSGQTAECVVPDPEFCVE